MKERECVVCSVNFKFEKKKLEYIIEKILNFI